jgi:hypothetical protein
MRRGDPATESKRKIGAFARQTRRERILMSADQDDWLRAAARRGHRTADASSVVVDALARAVMDPEHAALDDLLR